MSKMKRRLFTVDMLLLILGVTCAVLCCALAISNPYYFIPVLIVLLIIAVIIFFNVRRLRSALSKALYGSGFENSETRFSLTELKIPVLALSDKNIVWYNNTFLHNILDDKDACLLPISKLIPGFDMLKISEEEGQDLFIGEHRFTIYGGGGKSDTGLFVAYFIDNTVLKAEAAEYKASRPCVLIVTVDTYDEILKELKESERAHIAGEIDLVLERFIAKTSGFLRRTSASRYIAVVEERNLQDIESAKFDLLDTVRAIGDENVAVTLSIGVGRGGKNMHECEEMASQALDMALGRGGDQAAVKSPEGFEFYGGVSRSVEKRSKVKSRIVATALRDMMQQCDSVLIMGHKSSDLDCVGAAIGMLRFCKICNMPAAVVINERYSLAQNLLAQFNAAGYADDFVSPEEVLDNISDKTLLIIVDTHLSHILESTAVYDKCKNVVVIDHHRKCMGYIENAVIFYHEPYASSASELVSELLQYIGDKEDKPTALEAQALLAGIMLDTRSFSLHTGVRTFEAAAYLRRMGAQTQEVKKLFASSFETYAFKSKLVTEAQLYRGCAVVIQDEMPGEMAVVVPQAANDLLTIEGVEASFVAVLTNDQVVISARSMGGVNVQLIMEKLGGGGHLTMAGAQMKNCTLAQAQTAIYDAIDNYRDSQKKDSKQ
ncbi:MAG: DHH family phosphoesterase [Oscillospiraceae bacterium]